LRLAAAVAGPVAAVVCSVEECCALAARYCGDACQRQDWNEGGHKETCGTTASKTTRNYPDLRRDYAEI